MRSDRNKKGKYEMKRETFSWSVSFAVAFVWFTTQFGGGFASGRQIVDYYVSYGWYAVFTPVLAQLLMALLFYVVLKTAFREKLKNYSEYTRSLYGKTGRAMRPLFEALYNLTLCIATAVAFATGGSTLTQLTGIPYLLSTLLIAAVMFVLTIFGYRLVQRAAAVVSVLIVAGMLAVLVPNLIYFAPRFSANYSALRAASKPAGSALWKMFLYVAFQMPALGAYVAHAKSYRSLREVKASMTLGFLLNSLMIGIAAFGMISIYTLPGALTKPVPMLVLVQSGIGSAFLTPVISALIFLGAISTGVNFVYGVVGRITDYAGRNEPEDVQAKKQRGRSMVFSLLYIFITFCVAQFGLIPLVSKGYSYCGYGAIFIVILPVVIRWFREKKQTAV